MNCSELVFESGRYTGASLPTKWFADNVSPVVGRLTKRHVRVHDEAAASYSAPSGESW